MAPRWQPETTNQLHPVQVLTSSGDAVLPMGFKPWGVPVWSSQCVWRSLLLDGRFGSVDQQDTPETRGATLAKWGPHLSSPTAKASRSQIQKLHGKQLSGQPSPGTKRPLGEMFGLQSLGSHSRKFFLRLRQRTSLRNWSKDEVDGNLGGSAVALFSSKAVDSSPCCLPNLQQLLSGPSERGFPWASSTKQHLCVGRRCLGAKPKDSSTCAKTFQLVGWPGKWGGEQRKQKLNLIFSVSKAVFGLQEGTEIHQGLKPSKPT